LKKYEALMILDTGAKEDSQKDILARVKKDIEQAGGRVEKIEELGPRPFSYVTSKKTSGFYVNVLFQAPEKALKDLTAKFHLDTELYRWQFTEVIPEPKMKPKKKKKLEAAAAAAKA